MRKWWIGSVGLALLLVSMAAYADEALFAPLDLTGDKALSLDPSYQALADDASTGTLRLVRANTAAVTEKAAVLTLNLEPGIELRVHRVEARLTRSGALVWSGVIEDPGAAPNGLAGDFEFNPINTAILVKNGEMITGNVHWSGDWYRIRPLKSGGHAIVKVNFGGMPPDHPAEYAELPNIRMPRRQGAMNKVNTAITVQVNYTPAVAAAVADVPGLITLAVAETNQGYLNSDVTIDSVLVNTAPTTYTESGSFSTDLTRYRTVGDGFMDEIHTSRDATGADVNVLLINNTSACGLASSIGSTAATAFVAVYWDCATGYYSFAHEIGHLQSARHDPKTDPTTTPYAWGHGYQYTKSPSWRTIMAYDCPAGCPRLDYWSNPSKLYNGKPMGTTTKNDNHRVLNDTRATVAAFR